MSSDWLAVDTAASQLISVYRKRIAAVGFVSATAEIDEAVAGRLRGFHDGVTLVRRNSQISA